MWSEEKIQHFREVLLNWYDTQEAEHNFPWRLTNDPYKIWVSEIMLQQTRSETVIPYYERFLKTFPSIKALAEAKEDDVLKLWEGLGYYSRARNLREAAKQIMVHYNGVFPDQPEEINRLKGIGPYTTGAISSIAFNLPTPAIDGNLMRVLSRLFEIDLDISKAKNRKVFETVALYLIDPKRPGDWNQAMMDLGRTVCTPKNYFPELSPVKEFNASYLNDTWQDYPVKKPKNQPKPVTYISLILKNKEGEYLLEKRPSKGLLANLWQFPLIEVEDIISDGTWKSFKPVVLEQLNEKQRTYVENYILDKYHVTAHLKTQTKGLVQHVFSHLKWQVSIFEGIADGNSPDMSERDIEWVKEEDFEQLAFPTVQKKIWDRCNEITLF